MLEEVDLSDIEEGLKLIRNFSRIFEITNFIVDLFGWWRNFNWNWFRRNGEIFVIGVNGEKMIFMILGWIGIGIGIE